MSSVLRSRDESAVTARAARKFARDAEAFTKKATTSKKTARDTLVALGTHTRDGSLTKPYRK